MKSETDQNRAATAWQVDICDGLTMRDYFAAAALQGIRAWRHGDQFSGPEIARFAYTDADAMLKERDTMLKERDT